ncbi:MAG: type II toxin-antitoxin system RelE/ParE family toxin [Candidatus Binatia bacterium]
MARYRISAPAQADLENILATSLERWGVDGRSRYASLLAAAFRTIADQPTAPTTRARDELFAGLRSFHVRHSRGDHGVRVPVHVVFYRTAGAEVIEIVRVLHERMDPARHVHEPTGPPGKSRRRAHR